MRPLELRLRDFRSFYGDGHCFDFRDRGLIGIVGPIGSGKSTILDAISFALYSRTPRIGKHTSTLINQRAESAAVSFRFEVEGVVWEAVRQIRRKGGSRHALYRYPDDEPDPEAVEKVTMAKEVDSRIVELLGLDYEGFGRSVMLAQGQFARFLSAAPVERDQVLKGVFGYERVGLIRERAREAQRQTESEIEKLEVRIEHVEEARARKKEREEDLSETGQRLFGLEEALPRFREMDERISQAAERLRRVTERLNILEKEAGNLPDTNKSQALLEAASVSQARKQEAERLLAEAMSRLREAEAATESEEFTLQQGRLEEAGELLNRLKSDSESLQTRRDELDDKADRLPDREGGIRAIKQAESDRGRRVQATREWEVKSARLGEADKSLSSDDYAQRVQDLEEAELLLVELRTRTEGVDQAAGIIATQTEELAQAEQAEARARSSEAEADAEHRKAESAQQQARRNLDNAQAQLQEVSHQDMAGTLREGLSSGDQCPVCDQPVHQVPPSTEGDLSAAQQTVEKARSDHEAAEQRLRQTSGKVTGAQADTKAAVDRAAACRQRLTEAQNQQGERERLVIECREKITARLGEGDPPTLVEQEKNGIEALGSEARQARTEAEEARKVLDEAQEEERRADQALSEIRAGIMASAALLKSDLAPPQADPQAIREALVELHSEWERVTADLESELQDIRRQFQAATERQAEAESGLNAFQEAVKQARNARDQAQTDLNQASETLRKSQESLSNLRLQIGNFGRILAKRLEPPENHPEAIKAGLSALHAGWAEEVAKLERQIKEKGADRQFAEARLLEEQAKLGIEGSIGEALARVKAQRDQIVTEIERDQQSISAGVELLNQKQELGKEADLYIRLVKDLTDARFIRFLLDEERATLSGLGSEHFERLSSERYRFTEDGTFNIIDRNSADTERRADSLSGGETFLASLALALGLAEMVGRRGGRLDAFFLDEGFGTLDPEHVELAMAGVESLAAGRSQRLVVVVSHVRELRERIEDLIILEKHPLTGDSKVKPGGGDDDF